jgi:hypothetical protein
VKYVEKRKCFPSRGVIRMGNTTFANMRARLMLLFVAMGLTLVMLAASPAFAQATAIDEGDDVEFNAVCQNIIGSIGDINQGQYANADAIATDDSAATAKVAQEQNVTISQVNNCLNEVDADDDGVVSVVEIVKVVKEHKVVVATVSASSSSSSSASSSASTAAEVQYSTPAAKVLPETSGAPLLALGAGALLVAGGLVARRIVR